MRSRLVLAVALFLTTRTLAEVPCWEMPDPSQMIVPAGSQQSVEWRYTAINPGAGWMDASYDDHTWSLGATGFGDGALSGDTRRTSWTSDDLWLRKKFTLTAEQARLGIHFWGRHDDGIDVYVNGFEAAYAHTWAGPDYRRIRPLFNILKHLQEGENQIAVHVWNTGGGRYFDLGIVADDHRDFHDGMFTFDSYVLSPGNVDPVEWKYTLTAPSSQWTGEDYDDSGWYTGPAAFGDRGNFNNYRCHVRTFWPNDQTVSLWLRRNVEISPEDLGKLGFWTRYDDAIEVYVNGVLAFAKLDWDEHYSLHRPTDAGQAAFRAGMNTIAVKVTDYGGAAYFDLGLVHLPLIDPLVWGGQTDPRMQPLVDSIREKVVQEQLPGVTYAITWNGNVILNGSMGWFDRNHTQPMPPGVFMRLASNDKVITRAGIWQLLYQKTWLPEISENFTYDTKVFRYLQARGLTPPPGMTPDPRINDITVQHLLDHTSGIPELPWYGQIYEAFGACTDAVGSWELARWIYGQPLRWDPGTNSQYTSSGYFLLRYLVEIIAGDWRGFYQAQVFPLIKTDEIAVCHEHYEHRHRWEPFYLTNEFEPYPRWLYLEDYLGLMSSAEGMARYLAGYRLGDGMPWIDPATGEPAPYFYGGWYYEFNGGMSGTRSHTFQKVESQKIATLAVICNGSGNTDELQSVARDFFSGLHGFSPPPAIDTTPPVPGLVVDKVLNSASGPLVEGHAVITDDLIGVHPLKARLFYRPENGTWQEALDAVNLPQDDFRFSPGPEGVYHLQVVSTDLAGNTTPIPSGTTGTGHLTVTLDTTAPTGTVTINDGAQAVNTRDVTLTLSADDAGKGSGVTHMRLRDDDDSTWTDWEAYGTSRAWNLSAGDGTKTVYVRFKDAVEHPSQEFSDTIILDTMPPTVTIGPPSTPLAATRITFSVTYADTDGSGIDGISLVAGDVILHKSGTADGTVSVNDTKDALAKQIVISGITGEGSLGISIGADTARDLAGNPAPARGPSDTVVVIDCDVDDDGLVDAVDVQLVINAALGIPSGVLYDCDINGDGTVDALDVQLAINAALGII